MSVVSKEKEHYLFGMNNRQETSKTVRFFNGCTLIRSVLHSNKNTLKTFFFVLDAHTDRTTDGCVWFCRT